MVCSEWLLSVRVELIYILVIFSSLLQLIGWVMVCVVFIVRQDCGVCCCWWINFFIVVWFLFFFISMLIMFIVCIFLVLQIWLLRMIFLVRCGDIWWYRKEQVFMFGNRLNSIFGRFSLLFFLVMMVWQVRVIFRLLLRVLFWISVIEWILLLNLVCRWCMFFMQCWVQFSRRLWLFLWIRWVNRFRLLFRLQVMVLEVSMKCCKVLLWCLVGLWVMVVMQFYILLSMFLWQQGWILVVVLVCMNSQWVVLLVLFLVWMVVNGELFEGSFLMVFMEGFLVCGLQCQVGGWWVEWFIYVVMLYCFRGVVCERVWDVFVLGLVLFKLLKIFIGWVYCGVCDGGFC